MDSDSWLLFISLIALILASGYFAAAEMAFASSNTIRIKSRAEGGDRRAKRTLYVLSHFDRALSTLLVGNNVMHIGIASIATLLVTRLWGVGFVAYATVVTTVVVFLLSEMIPKSFAADKPETVALLLANSLCFLMWLLRPVTAVFDGIGNLFSKVLGGSDAPSVTEEELYDIIETIAEEGALEESRSRLICSALEFDEITAQEILTARVAIVGIEADMSHGEVLEIIRKHKFSRLPVYVDTVDNIVGVLNVRRFLKNFLSRGEATPLAELMDKPHFVPRKRPIDELLSEMSAKRLHMAVVTDDYGGTMGIVTVEDILEELVGEIWDEDDEVREDFKALGGNRFEVSGDLDILDAFELMAYDDCPDELDHKTVAAWAQENFNIIPQKGSSFTFGRLTATVLQISNHTRITKMLLKLEDEVPEPSA
ncbi:MAG: HlyC/CorC family transporter [Clostridiales bacterium]|nr:HlyC/CorC family transporter [Clostridiales bacterium]